jgi:Pentapeptide repeats (8 copies)
MTDDTVLDGANLDRANLHEARLFGVDLSGASLQGTELAGACWSDETRSPAIHSTRQQSGRDLPPARNHVDASATRTTEGPTCARDVTRPRGPPPHPISACPSTTSGPFGRNDQVNRNATHPPESDTAGMRNQLCGIRLYRGQDGAACGGAEPPRTTPFQPPSLGRRRPLGPRVGDGPPAFRLWEAVEHGAQLVGAHVGALAVDGSRQPPPDCLVADVSAKSAISWYQT